MEFRHASWFTEEVYALLRQHDVALVTAESEDTAAVVVPTAPYGYLRLHKPAYTPAELDTWAATIKAQPWEEAWIYFKHDNDTAGPRARSGIRRALRLINVPSVRRATAADAALLAAVARRTFYDAYSGDDSSADLQIHMDRHFGVSQQAVELADPATTTLVLEDDERQRDRLLAAGRGPGRRSA